LPFDHTQQKSLIMNEQKFYLCTRLRKMSISIKRRSSYAIAR
jgi:hypothetical protein